MYILISITVYSKKKKLKNTDTDMGTDTNMGMTQQHKQFLKIIT